MQQESRVVTDATKVCIDCELERPIGKFPLNRGRPRSQCSTCKGKQDRAKRQSNPNLMATYKIYQASYYKERPHLYKLKSYQHSDKTNNRISLTRKEFLELITNSVCFYCYENNFAVLGLDRIDNNLGHEIGNVRVCCDKCNNIMGDIPDAAKLIIKDSLIKIKEQNLLSNWVIPTKRKQHD